MLLFALGMSQLTNCGTKRAAQWYDYAAKRTVAVYFAYSTSLPRIILSREAAPLTVAWPANQRGIKMKVLTAVHGLMLLLVFCVAMVCAQTSGFTLQVASVPTEAEAQAMTKQLQAKGLESYWNKVELEGKGTRYRIYVGHFASREEARQKAEQARRQGLIKEFILLANHVAPKAAANTPRETKTTTPSRDAKPRA